MKQSTLRSSVQCIFLATIIIFTSLSCKKESSTPTQLTQHNVPLRAARNQPVSRAYSDHFITTFTSTNPVFGNGYNAPPTAADFPGGGYGNVTHMGKAETRFNSQITFATLLQVPVHLYSYPPFAVELAGFHLPVSMVNSIVFDDKQNSIWFTGRGGSAQFTDAAHTIVAFSVQSDIVGGTGKFENATGNTVLSGQFNLTNGTAEFSTKGTIIY